MEDAEVQVGRERGRFFSTHPQPTFRARGLNQIALHAMVVSVPRRGQHPQFPSSKSIVLAWASGSLPRSAQLPPQSLVGEATASAQRLQRELQSPD